MLRGMAKFLLQWEREAQLKARTGVFDHAFIAEHGHGVDEYLAVVDATPWEQIEAQSGLTRRSNWSARASRQVGDHVLGDGHHPAPPLGADHPGNRQPDAAARQHRRTRRRPVPGTRAQQRAG
jgi:hypothetical protein